MSALAGALRDQARNCAALALQDATVDKADAIDWLRPRLQTAPPGKLHLIFHSIAWQYFAPETQTRGRALIEAAGRRATPHRRWPSCASRPTGRRPARLSPCVSGPATSG